MQKTFTRLLLTSSLALILANCSGVDVDYAAPDFNVASIAGRRITVTDEQAGGAAVPPGTIASDLARHLAPQLPGVTVRTGTPAAGDLVLTAVVTDLGLHHSIEHDIDEVRRERKDGDGKVIERWKEIDEYETIARTEQGASARFVLLDGPGGQPLWIATDEERTARSRTADSHFHYPPAPPFPAAPSLFALYAEMNEDMAGKLAKDFAKSLR